MELGIVYWKVAAVPPFAPPGQPPSMLLMTTHFVSFVGSLSVVKEIWQLPPPCVAEPRKLIVCGDPIAMEFFALAPWSS